MKTVFLRLLEAEEKGPELLKTIRDPEGQRRRRFEVEPASFANMPRSAFAYWVSDRFRRLFAELPPFEADGRTARQGLATADDFRFVRGSWEIPFSTVLSRWFPFAKGGVFSPFYADVYLVVNWQREGSEIKNFANPSTGRPYSRPQNTGFFFCPGLTWPLRTKSNLSFRAMASGCIFAHKGPAAFAGEHDAGALLALLAIAASRAFRSLIEVQLAAADAKPGGAAHSFEVGIIQSTPVPNLSTEAQVTLGALSRRAWLLGRALDTRIETSHASVLPALLQAGGPSLLDRGAAWAARTATADGELTTIQNEIDAHCFALYCIDEADQWMITEGFSPAVTDDSEFMSNGETEDEEGEVEESIADATNLTAELVSWGVGVAFGRFDVRLATGERPLPQEPEPFDPLPVCSPGMLAGEDGRPLASPPDGYPIVFPTDGVLVDDPGHMRDLTDAIHSVFDIVFGEEADACWQEAASLLAPKDGELRGWLARSFFEHHLKRYSKSRRKAPILWQLATPSASYSVWLYAHRLTPDSLFRVLNDHAGPKLVHEERGLVALSQDAGPNPTPAQRRDIARQEIFVEELHAMREELARVAPLWNPDLNDGVVLAMAPLWRLAPQNRGWQRELKAAWDSLCAGKYDWAHLAMHLWPERVVPKCATDRSLAIAHGVEDVFWVEGPHGKWQRRTVEQATIDELIQERTSPAVKDALKSLNEAPQTGSSPRTRSRRGRADA